MDGKAKNIYFSPGGGGGRGSGVKTSKNEIVLEF